MRSSLGALPTSEGRDFAEALTGLSDACASNRRVNRPPSSGPVKQRDGGLSCVGPSTTARFVRRTAEKTCRLLSSGRLP